MLKVVFRITLSALVFLAGFGVSQAGEQGTTISIPSSITFSRMMRATNMLQTKITGAEYLVGTVDEWIAVHSNTTTVPPRQTVVVRKGDTLSALFGREKYRTVAAVNDIADPDRIFVGQTIALPPGVKVITHAKQKAVRTQPVHTIATPAHPEFVETKFGTAWVFPGTDRVRIEAKDLEWTDPEFSTAALVAMAMWTASKNISEDVQGALVSMIATNENTVVELAAGDSYNAMLFARNEIRWNVLAAWSEKRVYHGLCHGVRGQHMDYLMIRELASGNWIFHSLPRTGTEENTACERLRRSL